MDVNSHLNSVTKVGFRKQINYMKFMKVCILVLQKQLSIKSDFCNQIIKCQTILTRININNSVYMYFATIIWKAVS